MRGIGPFFISLVQINNQTSVVFTVGLQKRLNIAQGRFPRQIPLFCSSCRVYFGAYSFDL